MSALRIVLGDQLSIDLSALAGLDPGRDTVMMMEVAEEGTYVPHHEQKIVLVLSAMRYFADELRQRGVAVDYVPLDAPGTSGALNRSDFRPNCIRRSFASKASSRSFCASASSRSAATACVRAYALQMRHA